VGGAKPPPPKKYSVCSFYPKIFGGGSFSPPRVVGWGSVSSQGQRQKTAPHPRLLVRRRGNNCEAILQRQQSESATESSGRVQRPGTAAEAVISDSGRWRTLHDLATARSKITTCDVICVHLRDLRFLRGWVGYCRRRRHRQFETYGLVDDQRLVSPVSNPSSKISSNEV
jgi:hypothetical protein